MTKYDESSIKILEGLDAVRKRPGMYIGSTDKRGLHHLVWEIVDNSIDEVLNGFGTKIKVTINKNNSVTVEDDGRGIPVGMHSSGKTTPEVIFTVLHAGGKFESSGYKVSGGLHGVGASVVNALSDKLEVTIKKEKKTHYVEFIEGGKINVPLSIIGDSTKSGTKVTFHPSKEIFGNIKFSYTTICERMQECAFLLKDLYVEVIDEEDEKSEIFHYNNGLKEFVKFINEDTNTLHEIVSFQKEIDEIEVNIAFQYTDSYSEKIVSFVNNVKTIDGGSHEIGFKTAFTRAFNEYAKNKGFIKQKDKNFEGSDIREGLTSIISVNIPEAKLQFEGQTKGKLGTPEARNVVESVVMEKLQFFLEENSVVAKNIIEKMMKSKLAREAAKKAREDARNNKGKGKKERLVSGKLTPAQTRNPNKNELFLVEGDSAGGSAKQGRDKKFQAILPLRGKVINTEKSKMEDILKNEEISTIIYTIGASVGSDFQIKDVNYDKIIIMTDADDDGAHIQVLLLTFFYRYMRELIENGKLYIAMPPFYKVQIGKQEFYAWDNQERDKIINTYPDKKYTIQRYKGLGEMDADQLWDTTMNPETRSLIKVNINDIALAEKRVRVLMGDKVEPRKEWIEENVEFTYSEDN